MALSQKGKWAAALKAFEDAEAKHHKPTVSENRALLYALARDGGPAEAWAAVHRLRVLGALTAVDYEHALRAHEKPHHWSGALKLLSDMDKNEITWTVRACSHALLICGVAGRLNDALQLVEEMRKRGMRPGPVDFLHLIGECRRSRRKLRAAEDIWREMQRLKITPNTWSYSALINCYTVAGDPEKAEAVLAIMRQSTMAKPDAIAYNRYVQSTCSCLLWIQAAQVCAVCFECRTAWHYPLQPLAKQQCVLRATISSNPQVMSDMHAL
ncbi:hypothetical protein JKP88DRAFT_163863 [Tribonema minus]|uniref:Pentatricopeptide repeat-containing protein n=1 Tax=Tribonema minus TaxID=303371 RepID=A0A835Z794_9STRA|nr:hypothetical protein JKP88DRAFT_163863 [Tribonema minus]